MAETNVPATPEEIKTIFYSKINEDRKLVNINSVSLTPSRYQSIIADVYSAKIKSKKEPRDYRLLKRYDVLDVEGVEKLIVPFKPDAKDVQYFVCDEELFDILHKTHIALDHGGRDRMMKDLRHKYKNITYKDIRMYLELCEYCIQRQKREQKGLGVRTSPLNEINSRCQIEVMDYREKADGEFQFILFCEDPQTKFVILKPLRTSLAEEVASELLDIFTLIGAPCILGSGVSREFSNVVVNNLQRMWPEVKIVSGKSISDDSDSLKDIKSMIDNWIQEKGQRWSEGLKFIQLSRNNTFHEKIECSPYEALFGRPIRMGIPTTNFPEHTTLNIKQEEELEKVLEDCIPQILLNSEGRTDDCEDNRCQEETPGESPTDRRLDWHIISQHEDESGETLPDDHPMSREEGHQEEETPNSNGWHSCHKICSDEHFCADCGSTVQIICELPTIVRKEKYNVRIVCPFCDKLNGRKHNIHTAEDIPRAKKQKNSD